MFIGNKVIENGQHTEVNSIHLVEVTYVDSSKEVFSERMYEVVQSETECDLTALRDKRIEPVVKDVLTILRDWGVKMSELPYFSNLLNTSLMENEKAALKELWKPWISTLNSLDDVDLIAVDRVLKTKNDK